MRNALPSRQSRSAASSNATWFLRGSVRTDDQDQRVAIDAECATRGHEGRRIEQGGFGRQWLRDHVRRLNALGRDHLPKRAESVGGRSADRGHPVRVFHDREVPRKGAGHPVSDGVGGNDGYEVIRYERERLKHRGRRENAICAASFRLGDQFGQDEPRSPTVRVRRRLPPGAPEWPSSRRAGHVSANGSIRRTRRARGVAAASGEIEVGEIDREPGLDPSRHGLADDPLDTVWRSFEIVCVTSTTTRSGRMSSCEVVAEPRSSASSKRATTSCRTAPVPSILSRRATRSTLRSPGNEPSAATSESQAFARSGHFPSPKPPRESRATTRAQARPRLVDRDEGLPRPA